MLRCAWVLMVLVLPLTATAPVPAAAQTCPSYIWSAGHWARLMPSASQLPSGFTPDEGVTSKGGKVPFSIAQWFANPSLPCSSATYPVAAILGWQNDDLALSNRFLGGARTWLIGTHTGLGIPVTTPQVWVAMAVFPGIAHARSVMRGLLPVYPQSIVKESVTPVPNLGTPVDTRDAESVPALHGTLVWRTEGSEVTDEYLIFVRSSVVVEIVMTNPDDVTVMRLGRIVDANLVRDGKI